MSGESKSIMAHGVEREHNAHEDFLLAGQHQGVADFKPRPLAYGPEAVLGYDPNEEDDGPHGLSAYLVERLARGNRIPGRPRRGGRTLDDDDAVLEDTRAATEAAEKLAAERADIDAGKTAVETAAQQVVAEREALAAERAQLEDDKAAHAKAKAEAAAAPEGDGKGDGKGDTAASGKPPAASK